MAYRVTAGYVSVLTNVGPGRAVVDVPRGAVLPGDVPEEQLQRLLAGGHVEPEEPVDDGDSGSGDSGSGDSGSGDSGSGDSGSGDEVDLSAMDKDALLAYAEEHGIAVDKRLGEEKLRAAIQDAE